MKIIIPMAGNGRRFSEKGYSNPKPFIQVNGKPMIRQVISHLNLPDFEYIFLCKSDHLTKFDLSTIFPDIKHKIIPIDKTTEGAAITVLNAEKEINHSEDILIVNSDQLLNFNKNDIEEIRSSKIDGCIWCFRGTGPNWSYVKLNESNDVIEVAEKKQISEYATGGMYYWKNFGEFLSSVNRMIQANDRTNNEFYIAPAYNYAAPGSRTIIKMLNSIDQLGTPEELELYIRKEI